MNKYVLLSFLIIAMNLFAKKKSVFVPIQYPNTEKIPHEDVYFGTTIIDNYQWLEDDNAPATKAWVEAENKVTTQYLESIPYRNQLKERYKEMYNYTKLSSPQKVGNYFFFSKQEGLKNQATIYIQNGLNATPEVFIDPEKEDPNGLTTFELSGASSNNQYIAIVVHKAGSDWSNIIVYDIATKKPLNDKLEWVKFSDAAWYKNGFFYSRYPKPEAGKELSAANENHSVYYHQLGDSQDNDVLVHKDDNPLLFHSLEVTEDEQYLILYKSSGTNGFETYYKKTTEEGWNFKPLFTGFDNKSRVIDVQNGKFIVFTDIDAPKYRLISVDPNNNNPKSWKDIIAESKTGLLEKVVIANGKYYAQYLENASNQLYSFDLDGKNKQAIALPTIGTTELFASKKTDKTIFYSFTSFIYPKSIFTINTSTGYSDLFFKPELTFNPNDYEVKQEWYKSHDGTKVSMFIVHKKGLALNKKNPTYLYAYGGFNISMTPGFSSSRFLLLENGGVFAMPNLRGGGEYGEEWHQAGMLMKKQTVFDDFIAAAEYLIKNRYTSSQYLGIAGGSNGGLLVGACMTQRPELFKVAFPAVGVMDMLKYHQFTIGWGWVPEYGSSEQSKEMFEYLKGYSPYHNLKPNTKYPATLVTTADHDDRVVPAHSFKFAAQLQACNDNVATKKYTPNPVLIRIGVNAGHGAGKPTSKIIEEQVDIWSFFFWNVGIKSLKPIID
ncbi:MAG: S9 family peptidase [Chitinophagales bacterium]|nr:S9 family peptidase [Chitinophagales bacterium]